MGGRKGMGLEAWKFAIYLFVPISASITFNDPRMQRICADYFQFLKYPANPNTDLKEQFEELQRKRIMEKEQRQQYADQVRELQERAKASRGEESLHENEVQLRKKSWFSWINRLTNIFNNINYRTTE